MEVLRQLVNPPAPLEQVVEESEDRSALILQCQENMIAQMQTLTNKHIAQRLALQSCD